MMFLLLLLLKCPAAAQTPRNLAPGFSLTLYYLLLSIPPRFPPLTQYFSTFV